MPGILPTMPEPVAERVLQDLVQLCLRLGAPEADLAILAEGNCSADAGNGLFYVKASGHSMSNIGPGGFSLVRFAPILEAMNGPELSDAEVRALLSSSRADESFPMPSVETFMHAYLLSLPDVSVIGHTHPTHLISLLSLAGCEELAEQRLFPDDVVCCGPATAFVPYIDPGLPLALAVRDSVVAFVKKHGTTPKTIWLRNHGLIAVGKSVRDVESAMFMGAKSARAWIAALSTGREIRGLSKEDIERIHTRPDEHYRQRLLWQIGIHD